MAFKSHRLVSGMEEGSRPSLTQLEKLVVERLQYSAACSRVTSLGIKDPCFRRSSSALRFTMAPGLREADWEPALRSFPLFVGILTMKELVTLAVS